MRILTLCEHLTEGARGQDHFHTNRIVSAIKGRSFKGFTKLVVGGLPCSLDEQHADKAIDWAAERLAEQIASEYAGYIAIVPVPGHECVTPGEVCAQRLFKLATAIANQINAAGSRRADPVPLLHWDAPQPSTHAGGGTRDVTKIIPHYRTDAGHSFQLGYRKVILIDDVVTSGAHLRAAEHHLRVANVNVLDVAFAVARTVHVAGVAFSNRVESYPDV